LSNGQNLPSNLVLGEGESVTSSNEFQSNLLLFWLRTRVALTDRRVAAEWPNTTLFGLIPVGAQNMSVAFSQIASTNTSTRFKPVKFILALILLVAGLGGALAESPAGVVIILLGVALGLRAFETSIAVSNTAGEKFGIEITPPGRGNAQLLVADISAKVAERQD